MLTSVVLDTAARKFICVLYSVRHLFLCRLTDFTKGLYGKLVKYSSDQ
jgi:hypothetical protein